MQTTLEIPASILPTQTGWGFVVNLNTGEMDFSEDITYGTDDCWQYKYEGFYFYASEASAVVVVWSSNSNCSICGQNWISNDKQCDGCGAQFVAATPGHYGDPFGLIAKGTWNDLPVITHGAK